MEVSVIPIGNSRGIRIPKSILKQLKIADKVEMEIHNKEILIRPVNKIPRTGWSDKFGEMQKNDDDKLLIDNIIEQEDFQWEW